jgi:gamma-glutamylputrescine oxidase
MATSSGNIIQGTRPLWVDPSASAYPTLSTDIQAEVAVVGAGITGIGAAYWLQVAGVRKVVVLERCTVAAGASGRNAGFVMAIAPENFPATTDPALITKARRLWEFTATNQQLLERTIEEFDLTVDYQKRGSLILAAYPAEWERIRCSAKLARAHGVAVELIARDALPLPYLREHYYGGAWYPNNAEMQPAAFVRGLARVLAARGVRIYEHSPVDCLVPTGAGWQLRVGNKTVHAERVFLSTNAYTANLFPAIGQYITPVRGQVLATAPLPARVLDCPIYANDGYEYWRQLTDGRLVVGGWRNLDLSREVGTSEELNPIIQSALTRFAMAITVGAAVAEYRWSGIMGFTPDALPLVGRVPGYENLVLAAGYTGHGLAMAYHCARVAVDLLLTGTNAYSDFFDPLRFSGT